jgi:hypothetical protein
MSFVHRILLRFVDSLICKRREIEKGLKRANYLYWLQCSLTVTACFRLADKPADAGA